MNGDIDENTNMTEDNRRRFWPQWLKERTRTAEEVQKAEAGETFSGDDLDGLLYGDREPVAEAEEPTGPDVEDIGKALAEGDIYRDAHPALDVEKGAAGSPVRGLDPETVEAALHDQGLSTKEAILEVRDELRALREQGGDVSKEADAEGEADAPDGDPALVEDVRKAVEEAEELTAEDNPDPEAVEAFTDRLDALSERVETAALSAEERADVEALAADLTATVEPWAESTEEATA